MLLVVGLDTRLVNRSSSLKSRICAAACAAFAILAVMFAVFHEAVNGPVELQSSVEATVVAGEFYPVSEWSAQKPPKIKLKLDTGQFLLLNQNLPFKFKFGDRVIVDIWRRRFFGYKTIYRPS